MYFVTCFISKSCKSVEDEFATFPKPVMLDFASGRQHRPTLNQMEDHGVPYMADERHLPDTLFIVAEEDWRCYKDDSWGGFGRMPAVCMCATRTQRTSATRWRR